MFLSNSWSDSNSSKSISYRTASDTTYNTAILSALFHRATRRVWAIHIMVHRNMVIPAARIIFRDTSKIGPTNTALITVQWLSFTKAKLSRANGIPETYFRLPCAALTTTQISEPILPRAASTR